jgi:hypothetical protein
MTPEFLAAVVDTLLPGDDALPSGTRAGLDLTAYAVAHRGTFDAIAAHTGGPEAFVAADEGARTAALQAVEHAARAAFHTLLTSVLSDYYEAAPVLAALGWPSRPPQPIGHSVSSPDALTTERLERVRNRCTLWRN